MSHLNQDIYRDEEGNIVVSSSKIGHIIYGPYLKIGHGSFTLGYILDFNASFSGGFEIDEVNTGNSTMFNDEAHQPEIELICDIVSNGSTTELAVAKHINVDVSKGCLIAKLFFKIPDGEEEGKDVIEFRISAVKGAAFKIKSLVLAKIR